MEGSSGSDITLYQFGLSHYNEKARWVFDYKGVPYTSKPVLPGFHFGTIKRLSGQTATPVVTLGDQVVAGSADIVERIDGLSADRPLFPEDVEARREVDAWISWLDEEIGPPVRLALFQALLPKPLFAALFFTQDVSPWVRTLYRAIFPMLGIVLRRAAGASEAAAAEARVVVDRGLTRVGDAAAKTGYLVGDSFTAADLTAGALFFPLFYPETMPSKVPDRSTPIFEAWLSTWRDHPGRAYIERLYADHRLPR